MNKRTWIITGILLAALSGMLFFSKTIYGKNMAVVTGVLPSRGRLNKKESVIGTANWAEKEYLYSKVNGEIISILTEEGDKVEKGQILAEINVNLNDTWEEDEIAKKRLSLDMESIRQKIDTAEREIEKIMSETYDVEEISLYELEKLEKKIDDAIRNEYTLRKLYEVGGISKEEYENASSVVLELEKEYKKAQEDIEKNKDERLKDTEKKKEDRQGQIEILQNNLKTYQREMEMKQLDFESLVLQNDQKYEDARDIENNRYIIAEEEGILLNIAVNKGQNISKGQEVFEIGIGNKFEIEVPVNKNNTFINLGDEVEVKNENYTFMGTVKKIDPRENSKNITITIESDELSGGESFDANFKKESSQIEMLVPNNCINRDSSGYYLLYIKRREGPFGQEFYVARQDITIGSSDDKHTVVTSGVNFIEPVVWLSNKPVSIGETVKIQNEEDFFVS